MAHFAKMVNGVVDQVIVIDNNNNMLDGIENEQTGIAFCKKLYGEDTEWIQTSYSNGFRKKYAGIGDSYDYDNDVFISPNPYPSWSLDDNFNWIPPIPMPEDGMYYWDEELQEWSEV
jgi:hypothetical protein